MTISCTHHKTFLTFPPSVRYIKLQRFAPETQFQPNLMFVTDTKRLF